MKLGFSTWGMPEINIEDAIPALAAIGYEGVELTVLERWSTSLESLDSDRKHAIRRLYSEHGVDLPAIAAHSPLTSAQTEIHKQSMWRILGAIELALELAPDSPPVINTTVGGEQGEWQSKRQLIVDRVGQLCNEAEQAGVLIAMEPHIGSAIHTPVQMIELIEAVESAALRVNFDYSHFLAQGMGLEECVDLLASHTVHTHMKGVDGRWPDFQFLTPGEDEYCYAHEMQLMTEAGYSGYFTAEVSIQVQSRVGYNPFAHARLAFDALTGGSVHTGQSSY